jgi:septum formation protein
MSRLPAGAAWAGAEALVLASRSSARRDLLSRCGIEPELLPADIDERALEAELAARGALSSVIARRLAGAKAALVSRSAPGRYVLGADQVVAFEDRPWAKARDRVEAASRLAELAGRSHYLMSAGAVARDGILLYEAVEIAEMRMRSLSRSDIETYLDLVGDEALASVGCYRIEGVGRLLFERVDADQAVILGLPLTDLLSYFRSARLLRL